MESDARFVACLPLLRRLVRRECKRRELRDESCEDLLGDVRLHLWKNDQRAWNQWLASGQSTSYLARLVRNVAVDTCRSEAGRRHHSQAAVQRGYWALRLEALCEWDGHELEAAIRILRDNEGCRLSTAKLTELATELPSAKVSPLAETALLPDRSTADPRTKPAVDYERKERIFRIARAVNRGMNAVRGLEDRFLLRAVFYKGLTVTAAAKSLGMPRRRAYDRIESLCRRTLRRALEAEGLGVTDVREAMEAGVDELPVDWQRLEVSHP